MSALLKQQGGIKITLLSIMNNQLGSGDYRITLQKLKTVLDNLDPKLTSVFIPWALRNPRYLRSFVHLVGAHKSTEQSRARLLASGLKVPPFLILSITRQCNLNCAGYYAAANGTVHRGQNTIINPELNREQWREIISEASELGVFGFVIAGGEPFLFQGLLEICEEFHDRFFLIVTNGTALTEKHFERLKHLANVAVIVSVEGGQEVTDARRGSLVYERGLKTLQRLNKIGTLTGISITINRLNYSYWMNPEHIDQFIAQGVRIGVFLEYIPTSPSPAQTDVRNWI